MSQKACHDRHRPYHNTFALAAHAPGDGGRPEGLGANETATGDPL